MGGQWWVEMSGGWRMVGEGRLMVGEMGWLMLVER